MDLESGKVTALQAELEQERENTNAFKLELYVELDNEKVKIDAMITELEQQKATLEQELSGHNTTKRYRFQIQRLRLSIQYLPYQINKVVEMI